MTTIAGIRIVSGKNIYEKVGDALGVYKHSIQDSSDTLVHSVDSLGRELFKAATAPGTVTTDFGSLYITASGVTPSRTVALKYMNESGVEFIIFSWLV